MRSLSFFFFKDAYELVQIMTILLQIDENRSVCKRESYSKCMNVSFQNLLNMSSLCSFKLMNSFRPEATDRASVLSL